MNTFFIMMPKCLHVKLIHLFITFLNALCWIALCRSADHDCGPGGLWEIITAFSHAGRDAEYQWKSLLEQVRQP